MSYYLLINRVLFSWEINKKYRSALCIGILLIHIFIYIFYNKTIYVRFLVKIHLYKYIFMYL